jgi:hypothetical protein
MQEEQKVTNTTKIRKTGKYQSERGESLDKQKLRLIGKKKNKGTGREVRNKLRKKSEKS